MATECWERVSLGSPTFSIYLASRDADCLCSDLCKDAYMVNSIGRHRLPSGAKVGMFTVHYKKFSFPKLRVPFS